MQRTQTVCLVTLASVAVGFSLAYLQTVLLPFVIALFVVIGCRPILKLLHEQLGLPQLPAFAVTFTMGIAVLLGFAYLTWVSIQHVSENSAAYEARLGAIVTWVSEWLDDPSSANEPAISAAASNPVVDSAAIDAVPGDASEALRDFTHSISRQLQSVMISLAGSLSTLLSYGVLIVIFVFFLLMGGMVDGEHRPAIVAEIEEQVRKYLYLKTVISLLTGLAFGLVLWLFNVPLAVVFGLLACLLNFIPNIGPLIANLLPVPFLVLNSQIAVPTAIICFVLMTTVQFVSGNVIEPRLMGKSFDVSPVVLLLALMFFGLVWGIVGMFLATPLVSIAKIVLQQSHRAGSAAELIAGRWPPGWSQNTGRVT